jgi:hypothetical protein
MPLSPEATARFETLLKSDPSTSATVAQLDTTIIEGPEVSASELQFRLFARALGREQSTEMQTPAHELVAEATRETLNDVAKDSRNLPRRPQLLPQLMQAVNDDASSMRAIARLIARDPTLTGNLLRIANSPAYRMQPAPVESIERAVAVLGTHGIRSTIAAAVMQPVLTSGGAFGPLPELIWEHSLRAASAAEAHAMLIGNDDPFAAQLLGLLYGLGAIATFRRIASSRPWTSSSRSRSARSAARSGRPCTSAASPRPSRCWWIRPASRRKRRGTCCPTAGCTASRSTGSGNA